MEPSDSLTEDRKAHAFTVQCAINIMRSGSMSVLLIDLSLALSKF